MSECHHLDRCGLSSAPTRGIRICDGAELATYLAPLRRCARACYELVRGGRLRVRFFRFGFLRRAAQDLGAGMAGISIGQQS